MDESSIVAVLYLVYSSSARQKGGTGNIGGTFHRHGGAVRTCVDIVNNWSEVPLTLKKLRKCG